jgi:hypothetical protein
MEISMLNMFSSHYCLLANQVDGSSARIGKRTRRKDPVKQIPRRPASAWKIKDQLARSMVQASAYAEQTGLPRAIQLAEEARDRFLAV